MKTVTVWHNIATDAHGRPVGMMDEYRAGHPLVPVARFEVPDMKVHDFVAEYAYQMCNIGHDAATFGTPDPIALEYRARKNRSMSVGDVVQIADGHYSYWYACGHSRWQLIEEPAWFAIGASTHGTTSLDRQLFGR